MNPEQAKSSVRWLITTFGPFIIQNGWASASTLEVIGGVIITVAPWVWSLFVHTEANAVAVVVPIATGKASDTSVAAQTALIEGTKSVALDKSIPASTEAKAALLDAVAAQTEVVGKINVTDQKIVDATQSPQIQKAA